VYRSLSIIAGRHDTGMVEMNGEERAGVPEEGRAKLYPDRCVAHTIVLHHSSSMPLQAHGKRRAAAQDPPVKRFRVSRACDQCRTERSKCDGNQPRCAPCSESNRPCSYTSNPKKRGLPPGYIRTIELALALVFQQDAELEASLIARLGQANTVLLARDTKESNRLHKVWRRTKFCNELNKALTGEHSRVGEEGALSSGEDSDVAVEQETGLSRGVPDAPLFALSEGTRGPIHEPNMQHSIPSSPLTPLPANSWQLLEIYSTYTQCWFPISEKLDVLKLSYSYPVSGLLLSSNMPESGHHAEMWSIFALSSCQDLLSSHQSRDPAELTSASRLYTIAQSLIPNEGGKFHIGHVKALLNLALVNLCGSYHNPAWLQVGAASRILATLETPSRISNSRYVHVVASCYLLDNFLALLLDRRPYLDKSDLERVGSVEEDGLEEWQPWDGELGTASGHRSRSPTLALSSFNRLTSLIDVLVEKTRHPRTENDRLRLFADWKSTLSPKFDYIRSDSTSTPMTPPAILLQLTHFATALTLAPSQVWLDRILEILETYQQQLSLAKLPTVIVCLLPSIRKSSKSLLLDEAKQARIHKALSDFTVKPTVDGCGTTHGMLNDLNRVYTVDRYLPRRSSQISPQSFPPRFDGPVPTGQQHTTSLLEDLLPDMNPNQQPQIPQIPQSTNFSPIDTDFTSPAIAAYDPSISGDLESFFDELASLHGAKRLENQPQFMQNLGFAPEVSMAELMATQSGQYMSMDPSTFGTENESEPLQFPLSDYYDAS
jgi:hypothetical protein